MPKFKSAKKLLKKIRNGKIKIGDTVAVLGIFREELANRFVMATVSPDGLCWGVINPLPVTKLTAWCRMPKSKPGMVAAPVRPKHRPSKKFRPVSGDVIALAVRAAAAKAELVAIDCIE